MSGHLNHESLVASGFSLNSTNSFSRASQWRRWIDPQALEPGLDLLEHGLKLRLVLDCFLEAARSQEVVEIGRIRRQAAILEMGNFDSMDWGDTYDDGGVYDRNPVSGY